MIMKITIFIGAIAGGGAEKVVCELGSYLSNRNHDIEILTATTVESNYNLDKKVVVRSLDKNSDIAKIFPNKLRQAIKMLRLGTYIVTNKRDVYICFLPYITKALLFFRNIIKAPIIMSERNNPEAYPKNIQKELFSYAKKVEGIVFQTDTVKKYYIDHCEIIANSKVIPNAISRKYTQNTDIIRDKKIVAVGRFDKQKNFELLIKAFGKISGEASSYKLVIYGEGPLLKTYKELCTQLGIQGRVEFPGYVSNIEEKIRDASVYVLSSDYEGMPNALIEAMSLGLPCVSTDCGGGGARFLIENEKNGLLVPIGDTEAMCLALKRIINDESLAENLGKEAIKIRERLAPGIIYGEWESFIHEVRDEWRKIK
jgi:glycosyltransferase involved in cell wall biosynthesis